MNIQIITLFPDMFDNVFEHSMMLKAQKNGQLKLDCIDLRKFGMGTRKTVDDTPYGGGDGMLLKPEPVVAAIEHAKQGSADAEVILLSPQGVTFTQSKAEMLSQKKSLILVCGRYEGFDERIRDYVDQELSIGRYVLTGGEVPAMVVVDSVVRLIPGVLGGETSAEIESFSDGVTLEYPQYTRPENFRGNTVPEVLRSGNHEKIKQWREKEARKKTKLRAESLEQ